MTKDIVRSWREYSGCCDAFLAVLENLDKEYPPATNWEKIDRSVMRDYILRKNPNPARYFAIASGIPIERIQAIEALLL
jgi:hypothetical protein